MPEFQWVEIPEREYDSALGAVPPRVHYANGFLLGEPYSDRICDAQGMRAITYHAYRITDGKHFRASEPLTLAEFRRALGRSFGGDPRKATERAP